MIGLLQQVYAKVTRADVVLYRWAAGEELVLDSKVDPWWGKPELSAGMRPAPSLWRPEWPCYSTLESGLPVFIDDLQARVETVPQWVHDGEGNPEVVRFVRHCPRRSLRSSSSWSGQVVTPYRRFHGHLRPPLGFPAELVPALERFAHTASLWLKLVALHDDRRLWDRLLGRVTTLLPLLASAPNDDSFFAGLAALLSHGDGLEWNRVLIFSPVHPKESKVDLVYALGGIGHDHLERQKEFWERKVSLEELVRDRVAAPEPRGRGPEGPGSVDPLYRLAHEREAPISVSFTAPPKSGSRTPLTEREAAFRREPLRLILEEAISSDWGELTIPVELDKDHDWLVRMNAAYPGLFPADPAAATYVYPLCCYLRPPAATAWSRTR